MNVAGGNRGGEDTDLKFSSLSLWTFTVFCRYQHLLELNLAGVLLLFFLVATVEIDVTTGVMFNICPRNIEIDVDTSTFLVTSLEKKNQLPPRNIDLYPNLSKDRIVIVLYIHNLPQYLKLVIDSLSHVSGINETLLIVSHDGYFEEMNKIIGIKFCQVKQVFTFFYHTIAKKNQQIFPV
ncbi:hypothetical protein LXL04_021337 [Taraxacum kok-saghyz]